MVHQINVHYKMISSNYFFRKNGLGEIIITKVLPCIAMQHYLPALIAFIKKHIFKKISAEYWVNAENWN